MSKLDVLQINMVMLGTGILATPDEQNAFVSSIGTEIVVSRPPLIPVDEEVRPVSLVMSRERYRVDVSAQRVMVAKEFPQSADDVDELIPVVKRVLESSKEKPSPTAVGYNLQLVYDLGEGIKAHEQLGTLFDRHLPFPTGWSLRGGTCSLSVVDEERFNWLFKLETRFGDLDTSKVFLDSNLHVDKPSPETDAELLRRVWQISVDLVRALETKK